MLKVLKTGLYTTVQDRGRFGYRNKGVPVSGTMDDIAAYKINTLLENDPQCAVLEMTMMGPTLQFTEPTFIALGGAQMAATLNNEAIGNYKVYPVKPGDILSYGKLEKGLRAYLAAKDGFAIEEVMGSRSWFVPITEHRKLGEGMEIPYTPCATFKPMLEALKTDSFWEVSELEVLKGPEFELLTDKHLEALFTKNFHIAKENNRMAYQLEEVILGHQKSMLTSATQPGTVQLTPAGKLIILMKDGQTTGGYPRVLQLSANAISILAQKKQGDSIGFKLN